MVTKDGDEFVSDLEDYGLEEGGEDELDEDEEAALLESQLTDKQKAKLAAAGVTIKDYLIGNGPDLTDEDYDDEEQGEEEAGDGDEDGEEGVNGDKRAREDWTNNNHGTIPLHWKLPFWHPQ